jgi:hypothetical protein
MAPIHPGGSYLCHGVPFAGRLRGRSRRADNPITATVLAIVDARHSGIASAVNNALSRLGQIIAVAALPLAAGLSGTTSPTPPDWQPASRSP